MTAPGGWRERLPQTRGRLILDAPLAPYTWLRVGGPADALLLPEDEADLQGFLTGLDPGVPVTVLGVGSNTLVRDGGVDGVVVRLGRGFSGAASLEGARMRAGAATLDAQLARAAAAAGVAGLEFYTGVPGTVGGACAMNAGCYGAETKDVLVEAHALTRPGKAIRLSNAEMGFAYRYAAAASAQPLIFTAAVFQGRPDEPAAITRRMEDITARREKAQPVREKTGGSTFKNPPAETSQGRSAWRLIDEAGWRGRPYGGAMFSPQHANFLINTGDATAADLEGLGETARADVLDRFEIDLEWEVRRIGRAAPPPMV